MEVPLGHIEHEVHQAGDKWRCGWVGFSTGELWGTRSNMMLTGNIPA